MAALTQARTKLRRSVDRDVVPLAANVKAYEGAMACIDLATGYYRPGIPSTTLLAVGTFYDTADNLGGAAGAVTVQVEFSHAPFREGWENDTANPVLPADIGEVCYILDDHTVSMLGTGRSVAGRVMSFGPYGQVEIIMAANLGPAGA